MKQRIRSYPYVKKLVIHIDQLPDKKYILATDSQDTQPIKDSCMAAKKYDSFFVLIENGDYSEIWGFMGIIPYLNRSITRIK